MQESIRIAVLEDDHRGAAVRLGEIGFDVQSARTLDELQQIVKRHQPQVLLVGLADAEAGREACVALKERFDVMVPILLYADGADSHLGRLAREAGADGWIAKAWSPDRFRSHLEELLENVLY